MEEPKERLQSEGRYSFERKEAALPVKVQEKRERRRRSMWVSYPRVGVEIECGREEGKRRKEDESLGGLSDVTTLKKKKTRTR